VSDLYAVVVPVIVAFIIALSGAIAIRRYAGPAQAALSVAQAALSETQATRMALLSEDKAELTGLLRDANSEIKGLRSDIVGLKEEIRILTAENLKLRRTMNGPSA
jgi:hypothetical protein